MPATPLKPELNPKEPEDSISKTLDKVAKLEAEMTTLSNTVSEKLDGMNDVMSAILNRRVQELSEPEDGDTEKDSSNNEDLDWETSFKGKSKESKQKSSKSKEPEKVEDRVKQIVNAELKKRDELNKWDAKAYAEFPQLNDPNHPLRKTTEAILKERRLKDPVFNNSPAAIYDAVNIAYSDLVRKGEIVPETFQAESQRLLSIGDGTLIPLRGAVSKKDVDLSPSETLWAKNLGVSVDKYKERRKQLLARKGLKND